LWASRRPLTLPLMGLPPPQRIRCREIGESDTDGIIALLERGLPGRDPHYFRRALERLSQHPTPSGFSKYGYLLESAGAPVGVILRIHSAIHVNADVRIRCNLSSWYVEPAFRSYAAMLAAQALKPRHVTYFNISPAPHTLPILEAQGYMPYSSGRLVAVAALSAQSCGARVQAVESEPGARDGLSPSEIELLLAHARYGCVSLVCNSAGQRHPFIFRLLRLGLVSVAYLVYCRALEDFVRFAGPLGRFLALRGCPLVMLDSNGPIRGLIGRYSGSSPKYFKGPHPPRLGDLAYSELAMFGYRELGRTGTPLRVRPSSGARHAGHIFSAPYEDVKLKR